MTVEVEVVYMGVFIESVLAVGLGVLQRGRLLHWGQGQQGWIEPLTTCIKLQRLSTDFET